MNLESIPHRDLVNLALKKLYGRYDLVFAEFSPYESDVAFDILAINRYHKEIRIIECKSNRADFLADSKWLKYLPFCTHLAFLASSSVLLKQELPQKIGVIRPRIVALPNGTEKLEWYYERGCQQLHELGMEEYIAVLEGVLWQYRLCIAHCPPARDGCLKRRLKGH